METSQPGDLYGTRFLMLARASRIEEAVALALRLADRPRAVLRATLGRYLSPEEIEGVVQVTALKACDRIEAYDSRRPFLTWFTTLCHRQAVDEIRRLHRKERGRLPLARAEHQAVRAPSPARQAEVSDDLLMVRGMIERLPETLGAVLLIDLREGGLAPTKVVMDQLGITEAAVVNRRRKGRLMLMDLLSQRGFEW